MSRFMSFWKLAAATTAVALASCGGGGDIGSAPPPPPPTYAVGGTVSGLNGVAVLQNNLGDDLTISANGNFSFATALVSGSAYSITVKTQPSTPTQTCVVGNATGSVAGAAVTTATVTCTTNTYTVGGTVTGLTGSGLILQDNAGDDLAVAASAASFTFATPVASGATYNVTVKTQPTGPAQTCAVSSASGTIGSAAAASAVVTCTTDTAFVCGFTENGTVVTHSSDINASETWAGDGTVHLVPNTIAINAPATVTIQKCAIVKLADNVLINVHGASTGTSTATLIAAGDTVTGELVVFRSTAATSSPAHRWTGLRGLNSNSHIELDYTLLTDAAPASTAAAIVVQGGSTLPDPVLKVNVLQMQNLGGPGIHFTNAAFTADSSVLEITGAPAYPLEMSAMALGSVPTATILSGNLHDEILVVDNANIFDNLTISTFAPIHFKTDGVHVGGLAPTFVQNVTLTLNEGVTLKFEGLTGPPMVVFGDQGQTTDKNAALVVKGIPGFPVLFTSGAAAPAPGDWAGLWLATSNGSQIDNAIIEFAGGDAHIGPQSCGPFASVGQRARNTAALLVGDGTDQQYVPPADLVTNTTFRNNTGSYAIDAVWETPSFGPSLTASNIFGAGPAFCTQNKNLKPLGCFVGGVDQSGCLVP